MAGEAGQGADGMAGITAAEVSALTDTLDSELWDATTNEDGSDQEAEAGAADQVAARVGGAGTGGVPAMDTVERGQSALGGAAASCSTSSPAASQPSLQRASTMEQTVASAASFLDADHAPPGELARTRAADVHPSIRRFHELEAKAERKRPCFQKSKRRWADKDLENYRLGYPRERDRLNNARITQNLEFYQNTLQCRPNRLLVETLHADWWGQYGVLEREHGYIQWLFPIHERSPFNSHARSLQFHEADAIKSSEGCRKRLVRSYELMLDFYGLRLANSRTGELARSEGWKARFANLNERGHNYLRITRILKCLGELGFEHFKVPFLAHMLTEMALHGQLRHAADSCANYWVPTVKKDVDRAALIKIVETYTIGNGTGKAKGKQPAARHRCEAERQPAPARDPPPSHNSHPQCLSARRRLSSDSGDSSSDEVEMARSSTADQHLPFGGDALRQLMASARAKHRLANEQKKGSPKKKGKPKPNRGLKRR